MHDWIYSHCNLKHCCQHRFSYLILDFVSVRNFERKKPLFEKLIIIINLHFVLAFDKQKPKWKDIEKQVWILCACMRVCFSKSKATKWKQKLLWAKKEQLYKALDDATAAEKSIAKDKTESICERIACRPHVVWSEMHSRIIPIECLYVLKTVRFKAHYIANIETAVQELAYMHWLVTQT